MVYNLRGAKAARVVQHSKGALSWILIKNKIQSVTGFWIHPF